MIADILTVAWKEVKELLLFRGSWRSGFVALVLVPVLTVGVFIPSVFGREWIRSPVLALLNWAWLPPFLVANVVADSFAGERERHTLETLLASRLPDRAILFGKMGAMIAYGWGISLLILVCGLVTVNVTNRGRGLLFYPVDVTLGGVVLTLLTSALTAAAGVLISLRATTARQAQQTLGMAFIALLFGGVFGFRLVPAAIRKQVLAALASFGGTRIALIAMAVLLAADIVLVLAAMARFQRARLILD